MKTLAQFLSLLVWTTSTWLACGQAELTTDRSDYSPGEAIVVSFKQGPGNAKDWIALARPTQPNDQYLDWQYVDGTQVGERGFSDGQVTFGQGTSEPGEYEIRLFLNDGYSLLARTTITLSTSPRVVSNKSLYRPDETVVVSFRFGPGRPKDWIGIYPKDGPSSEPLLWFYVDGTQTGSTGLQEGTLTFVNGLPGSGEYEIRFFTNDSFDLLDTSRLTIQNAGPTLKVVPGDTYVQLEWNAVTSPAPVEKYEILSAPTSEGPFKRIAESQGLSYRHDGQVNGVERCYVVRAISSSGQTGTDSAPKCVAPYALGSSSHIAYQVPASTVGNLGFNGPLGMDFDVVNPIELTHLGAFDDGANGFRRTIVVRLFNRESQEEVVSLEFDSTTPGVLMGGSRFLALPARRTLPQGFRGTLVAEGYGAEEQAGSVRERNLGVTADSGNDSLFFLGSGRTGNVPGGFPNTVDLAPAVAYAAGTFLFDVTPPSAPGKPVISGIPGDGSVLLSWNPVLTPLPAVAFLVQRSEDGGAQYTTVATVSGTRYTDSTLDNGKDYCFRVIARASGNQVGIPSEPLCLTPDVPSAGIAYIVPEGTAGNQRFSGSAGNDFDVLRPVVITRLGVFDDLSDGLKRTITVRLYDRLQKLELARLIFPPDDDGELIGGSRFKTLDQPVFLPIGFQGSIVASGYGDGERDGNKGVGNLNLQLFNGGALKFVGRSRWGENPDQFPQIIDGGPVDRYAAGTFFFEAVPLYPVMTLTRVASGLKMEWTSYGILESANSLEGPWTALPAVQSGFVIVPEGQQRYFRVHQ